MSETLEQPQSADSVAAPAAPTTTITEALFGSSESAEEQGGESGAVVAPESVASTPVVEDDTEEVDYEGAKYKIPKPLKEALLRQSDYTRKTQEVAEERKGVQAERTQLQQAAQFQRENIKEFARLHAIDERLALFSNVNWQQEIATDATRAQALHIEFSQLQAQRGQLVGTLSQKQQQQTWAQQQATAKREQEALAVVSREVKDWSPEKSRQLEAYARAEGINTDDLRTFLLHNPAIVKTLDKAARYDQSMARPPVKPPAAPLPKPVTKVGGGGATNTKPLSELSPEEWATRRQERNQRRR